MKDYLHGTALLVGSADRLGDISDTVTDYDYGEKQVVQMRAFFDSLGRPAEYKPAVDAVNAAFENAKAWEPLWKDKVLRYKNATEMKQVGADASKLMAALQQAYSMKASAVPSSGKSEVYDPGASGAVGSFMKYLPWLIGAAVVIGVGVVAVPIVAPLITRRALLR